MDVLVRSYVQRARQGHRATFSSMQNASMFTVPDVLWPLSKAQVNIHQLAGRNTTSETSLPEQGKPLVDAKWNLQIWPQGNYSKFCGIHTNHNSLSTHLNIATPEKALSYSHHCSKVFKAFWRGRFIAFRRVGIYLFCMFPAKNDFRDLFGNFPGSFGHSFWEAALFLLAAHFTMFTMLVFMTAGIIMTSWQPMWRCWILLPRLSLFWFERSHILLWYRL